MDKITKDEFKRRMRAAEIEKRIKEAERKPVIVDQHGEIHEIPEMEGTVTIPAETPKRRPGRPKKERVAAEPEENVKAKKPGRKPKEKTETAPKKPGRKPKTEKPPVAAVQEDAKQEALKGLVEIADRWINGRKVDADRYKKISEDIDAQVKQYQGYIDTVKEMIR